MVAMVEPTPQLQTLYTSCLIYDYKQIHFQPLFTLVKILARCATEYPHK